MKGTPVGDSASPLMHRRRLRNELRTARQDKGLTQDQVATAMEWSLSKMNRIEKAKTGISANDLKALLPLYGITDQERTGELLALARAARQTPWWRGYSDVAPSTLLELIDYENAASAISQVEPMFVPGILQTEEYTLTVLRAAYGEESPAERVPALVDLRTRRRDLLTSESAPRFAFVLDEAVVRRLVGSPAIMSRQLRHLVSLADLPNVSIRVVAFAAGLHPGMRGQFKVIEFDDEPDEDVVFLEGPRGDFISDDPAETRSYLEMFGRVRQLALEPADSVGLLRKAAGEMTLSGKCPATGHDLPVRRLLARSSCLGYTAPLWNPGCAPGPNRPSPAQPDRRSRGPAGPRSRHTAGRGASGRLRATVPRLAQEQCVRYPGVRGGSRRRRLSPCPRFRPPRRRRAPVPPRRLVRLPGPGPHP